MSKKETHAPTISLVMPVFNGAKHIEESLASVYRQTRLPNEIIVVDDGSQDDTVEKVRNFNSEIIIISQENRGHASARNIGVQNASSEFIAFLDADDMWTSDKLESQIEVCTKADLIYTGVQNFGRCENVDSQTFKNGKCVTGDHLSPLLLGNFVAHSSVMVRRESFLAVGGYDIGFLTSPDWDLWLRMAQMNYRFVGIPEPKTLYRWESDSNSKKHVLACSDRLRVLKNALDRADPIRVPKQVQKDSLKNAWQTSAWFASNDLPKEALRWYAHAIYLKPTSCKSWKEVLKIAFREVGLLSR